MEVPDIVFGPRDASPNRRLAKKSKNLVRLAEVPLQAVDFKASLRYVVVNSCHSVHINSCCICGALQEKELLSCVHKTQQLLADVVLRFIDSCEFHHDV